jgi:hypothetical protein
MHEMIRRDGNQLVGQVMKMQTARNANVVDLVEVLWVEHGMVRLRFLERSRKPVVWVPIVSILELRETDENLR